ncbi:MAG: hypothetical protein VX777_01260 [Chlamydiota bacterium]|nr:hypothetical protein [Chlamydiota bacterium]
MYFQLEPRCQQPGTPCAMCVDIYGELVFKNGKLKTKENLVRLATKMQQVGGFFLIQHKKLVDTLAQKKFVEISDEVSLKQVSSAQYSHFYQVSTLSKNDLKHPLRRVLYYMLEALYDHYTDSNNDKYNHYISVSHLKNMLLGVKGFTLFQKASELKLNHANFVFFMRGSCCYDYVLNSEPWIREFGRDFACNPINFLMEKGWKVVPKEEIIENDVVIYTRDINPPNKPVDGQCSHIGFVSQKTEDGDIIVRSKFGDWDVYEHALEICSYGPGVCFMRKIGESKVTQDETFKG